MSTINDLEVNEHCLKISQLADRLKVLQRDGRETDLFKALSDIQRAAEKGQWRLNDLIYGRGFKPPEEQMGT